MMDAVILGRDGLPLLCDCGNPASCSYLDTLGKARWRCSACDPAGARCPLCDGSGRIPHG